MNAHYIRRRNHGGVPPLSDIGYGLRLTLAQPIDRPLTLGYAAHLGLECSMLLALEVGKAAIICEYLLRSRPASGDVLNQTVASVRRNVL